MTPAGASRQVEAPPETVTEGDAQYALDPVGRIYREVGPAGPGTPQELGQRPVRDSNSDRNRLFRQDSGISRIVEPVRPYDPPSSRQK